jgi:hypothetical protein
MPKTTTLPPDAILPTPYEEHLGEISDPRGHERKLEAANVVLTSFMESMGAGRVPEQTLEHIREAVGTLGYYAGYPRGAHETETFLESPFASSSYKDVACILPSFIKEMNDRIVQRVTRLTTPERKPISQPRCLDDNEIPF